MNYVAWGFVIVLAIGLVFYYRVAPASEPIDIVVGESWLDVELEDVLTGEVFRLSDFDVPIVVESFAVWCPTCKKQQDEIQRLVDSGDDSVHVSVNTDPNEDVAQVVGHVERYGYTWSFVVFPADATQMLIDDFGTGVVNAPRAPVILVCPDGMARLLESGVKDVDKLKEEIGKC